MPRRPTRKKPEAMNRREGKVLIAIVVLHREYGLDKQFTRAVVEKVIGSPCAGSLAGLAMLGYITQRESPDGLAYAATRTGHDAAALIVKGRRPVTVKGFDRGR